MSLTDPSDGLRFPCDCVSSRGGYSDPWAEIAKHKLLPDGTKEEILNLVAQEPKTISQIADALAIAIPSVHAHVHDLLSSELLRESERGHKLHPAERYYEPNFPVISEDECAELCDLCDELAAKVAALFRKRRRRFGKAFANTPLGQRGWDFPAVGQCVFARVQRAAREQLEADGIIAPPTRHRNGAQWVFWAVRQRTNGAHRR